MSSQPLPTSTPAAEGVDARGVEAFLDVIEATRDIEPHSLMIVRHGRLIADGWWAPYGPDRMHLVYSLSKSFTTTAAGLAVAEGLLDLDAPVISYFPEFAADITDPRSRSMLVRHIASMASGHLTDTLGEALTRDPVQPVRGFLLLAPDRDPGTVFAYNQSATYTLAAIVQKLAGQTLIEYLRPRLFDPLGIGQAAWLEYPQGHNLGFSGLHTTTDAIARLGLLYLNGGVWEGKQLLPASWVAEATHAHISNADGSAEGAASDWQQGYGFQFWMSRHGYRGDGAYGQFCVVLPEQDVVIAMTADTEQMQAVLNAAWEHLLPAFGPGAGGDAKTRAEGPADAALRRRLSHLEVPAAAGGSTPDAGPGAWAGTEFKPAGGRCADQPSLVTVTVTQAGDDGGFGVRLAEDGESLSLRCVPGRWTVSEPGAPVPTAVSGGWTDPGTFTIDVAFLETPHHLVVTCSVPERTFGARWRTMPLHGGPLRSIQAPKQRLPAAGAGPA
ncbi:MAG TPA: serine hydrolase domain-containing protein [Streptosporangiaceae bacterium]|jgi:CubicO group peptidase (beta-lactamase class C family)